MLLLLLAGTEWLEVELVLVLSQSQAAVTVTVMTVCVTASAVELVVAEATLVVVVHVSEGAVTACTAGTGTRLSGCFSALAVKARTRGRKVVAFMMMMVVFVGFGADVNIGR